MDKKIIVSVYLDKKKKKYRAITEDGNDVTSDINQNKLRYVHERRRVIVGEIKDNEIKWKTKKTSVVGVGGYDWRTREDIEEELQREINKTETIWFKLKNKKRK